MAVHGTLNPHGFSSSPLEKLCGFFISFANVKSESYDGALKQIEDKKYEAVLISAGYDKDKIKKLAFAFEGKELLIKEG